MRKVVTSNQKHQWLSDCEQGKTEAEIARTTGFDVRTVHKGIEQVRRGQMVQAAQRELIKDTLHRHHQNLLKIFEKAARGIELPSSSQSLSWTDSDSMQSTDFGGYWLHLANVEKLNKSSIILKMETKPEWQLLHEHMRQDVFWKNLNLWKKVLATHLEARRALQRKLVELLESNTGFQLVRDAVSGSFLYSSAIDVLFRHLIQELLRLAQTEKFQEIIVADIQSGDVKYSSSAILGHAPGNEEECKQNILAAIKTLEKSIEARNALKTYEALRPVTEKVQRAASDISIMGLLPGQCRICRRLGM